MRARAIRLGTVLLGAVLVVPGGASAEPVDFAHGTIDQRLTSTAPGTPAGFHFSGTYHAAGDPSAPPPYMRKMAFYDPTGSHYDTSVPERCTASDVELAARGAAACPEGSRLGGGTTDVLFMGSFPNSVAIDAFNNTGEQVMLAQSPIVTTVTRGRIRPDGSVEYASPTCFPSTPAGCPVDNVLQVKSDVVVPPYVRSGRAYQTTPAKCPKSGAWSSTIKLWWADGSVDTVAIRQPCTRPKAKPKKRRPGKPRRR